MEKAKAVEVLNGEYNEILSCRNFLHDNPDDVDYLNDVLIALLTAIDALQQDSSNDWISVKDRMPELFENVLTIDNEGKIFINWLEEEEIRERKSYFAYGGESVTHWQPLPEPPESEDDAE